MNWRKIGIILIGTLACTACNRFGPEIHKAEIEDAIRFNKAIDSYAEWYYVDACILGNLLMRVEQQTHCETYWQKMEYVKLFKIEEYFPEEDENRYMLVLEGLMAKYRDAEVILGPIRRNYRSRGCLYYIVEDCLSGMEYYIEYRCPVLGKNGELNIVSKKEKIEKIGRLRQRR